MTTIHVLGSNGFIGAAVQRVSKDLSLHCWSHSQLDPDHHFDLLDPSSWEPLISRHPTHVILLSWPGLPNYQELFHINRNLPSCIDLIDQLVQKGLQRLVVAGTCYEYGLKNGQLNENQAPDPVNCYAIAKDSLRRLIETRYKEYNLQCCWARIFYPFGEGQSKNSLLPSLEFAIRQNKETFQMSSGRQIRDYISVDKVAIMLLKLAVHSDANGIYNCGSGVPISLRELAEMKISEMGSSIVLELGAFDDRIDEPVAFWADIAKYETLL